MKQFQDLLSKTYMGQQAPETHCDTTPFPVPYVTPEEFKKKINASRVADTQREHLSELAKRQDNATEHVSVRKRVKYSLTKVENLRSSALQEMHVHKRHEGQYLLYRIISAPFGRALVNFAVEDTNGWTQIFFSTTFRGHFAQRVGCWILYFLSTLS